MDAAFLCSRMGTAAGERGTVGSLLDVKCKGHILPLNAAIKMKSLIMKSTGLYVLPLRIIVHK